MTRSSGFAVPSAWRGKMRRFVGNIIPETSSYSSIKLGYKRKGSEAVVGPMPPFGEVIKTDDDLWKIIAWIRSVYCERRAEDRC